MSTISSMKLPAENEKHTMAGRQHAVEVRKRLGRILDTHHLKEVRKRG
jgi:hypothetical protein